MHIYRCVFSAPVNHIKFTEIIEADTLGEVVDEARAPFQMPARRPVWVVLKGMYACAPASAINRWFLTVL